MTKPFYQEPGVTLYCGDCFDILPAIRLDGVDLCLTDPPYEISVAGYGGSFGDRPVFDRVRGFTDTGVDYSFLNYFANWFCFCSLRQLPELLKLARVRNHNLITWGKTNPPPTVNNKYLPDVEYIVHSREPRRLFGKYENKSCFYISTKTGTRSRPNWNKCPRGKKKDTKHPNEKPLELINKLMLLGTQPGELVIDPFAGSGTTLISAKLLGRSAIGIEARPEYCEIIVERLKQSVINFEGADC